MNSITNERDTLKLVNGTFSADEARKILMNLIQSKLTYHKTKNLRSYEKAGETDKAAEKRIQELLDRREELLQLLEKAEEKQLNLNIRSEVTIDLTAEND